MPVYFIQAGEGGPVKIGYAANVNKRLAALQTAHHIALRLLREVPGDRSTERWLHERFRPVALMGEWFAYSPEMMTVTAPPLADKVIPRLCEAKISLARIYAFAEHMGWTKHYLSIEAGLHPNTLRDFGASKWNPRLQTLLKLDQLIPDAFGTPMPRAGGSTKQEQEAA